MYKLRRKGVVCIAYASKPIRYLLLHRKLHWTGWEIIKGGSLARERMENTVKRELKEETGLKAVSCKRFPVRGSFIYDKKTQRQRKARGFSYQLFACEVKKGRIRIGKREHDGYKWCTYSQAARLLTWPNQRQYLRAVDKFVKKH